MRPSRQSRGYTIGYSKRRVFKGYRGSVTPG